MPKLNFIILCDKAFFDENNKLNITGVFDTINAPHFPAVHALMSVVVSADLEKGENTERLTFKMAGESEREIVKNEIEKKEGGTHTFIHNLSKVIFEKEGLYNFGVSVNGISMGSINVNVKKLSE